MNREKAKILEDFYKKADSMNMRIKCDTERYRKGDAEISVKINGENAKGAKIVFNQKNHEFRFGANCFMLDELETQEKNAEYKKLFANVFNLATVPFYWSTLEPEKGKIRFAADSPKIYRRPPTDLCVDFCRENGIEPKLHCLCYDYFSPDWYKKASIPECREMLEKRIAEIAERYRGIISDYEVANEFGWDKQVSSKFYSDDPAYLDWCFKTAEKYLPNSNLIINEGPNQTWWLANGPIYTQAYYQIIKNLRDHGRRIDKIGFQYHIWQYKEDDYENTRIIYDPECMFRMMDAYAALAPEQQVTEITLPAKGALPEDEDFQGELLEKVYRIWFSHPNMQAIIYWNLADGYAHNAKPGDMSAGENKYYGGLVNFDMTPKKAYKKLCELTKNEWHSEGNTVCDDDGKAYFRGFFGDYDVDIIIGEKTYKKEIRISKYTFNKFDFTL